MTLVVMSEKNNTVFETCDTSELFDSLESSFAKAKQIFSDICAACSKSTVDVKSHLANIARKKKRDAEKLQLNGEKAKVDAAARHAGEAADRAKAGMDAAAAAEQASMPSLFALMVASTEANPAAGTHVEDLANVSYLEDCALIGTEAYPVTHPMIAGVDTDNIAVHRGDAPLAKAIKWFSGKYAQLNGYEQDGRCQFSLQAKKGLEAVENILLASRIRTVDISEVSPSVNKSHL